MIARKCRLSLQGLQQDSLLVGYPVLRNIAQNIVNADLRDLGWSAVRFLVVPNPGGKMSCKPGLHYLSSSPCRYLEISTTFATDIHSVPAIRSLYLLLVQTADGAFRHSAHDSLSMNAFKAVR